MMVGIAGGSDSGVLRGGVVSSKVAESYVDLRFVMTMRVDCLFFLFCRHSVVVGLCMDDLRLEERE